MARGAYYVEIISQDFLAMARGAYYVEIISSGCLRGEENQIGGL